MIIIRELRQSDDVSTVGKIYVKSWQHTYRGMIPQDYLDNIREEQWAERLDCEGRHSLVVELDGKLIGTSSYGESRSREYAGQGEVYSIYFLPEHMGKGYGKQLMNTVLAELSALGYGDVFLWVLEDNIGARKFYESAGFVCSGEVKEAEIGGKAVREVRYSYKHAQVNQ